MHQAEWTLMKKKGQINRKTKLYKVSYGAHVIICYTNTMFWR